MNYIFKKITVLTGHYGVGKTNLAVNIAMYLRRLGTVSVVDADIVNPYFRTADFKTLFEDNDIKSFCPMYAGTNLDTPVLDFDMDNIIDSGEHVIIDVGGDDAGAYALGRYRHIFEKYANNTDMLYVFNMYRREDFSPEEAAGILRDIENACGMKCTALVNNSNLGYETDLDTVRSSFAFGKELEMLTGLDTAFIAVPEGSPVDGDFFKVKRMVELPWERSGK
ncbi:MAG: cobalamin biosynthesis protein CobQ [Oscillospiraceae bacterium]